jgi:hypothetical protein
MSKRDKVLVLIGQLDGFYRQRACWPVNSNRYHDYSNDISAVYDEILTIVQELEEKKTQEFGTGVEAVIRGCWLANLSSGEARDIVHKECYVYLPVFQISDRFAQMVKEKS